MASKPLYIEVLIENSFFALQQGYEENFILYCHLKKNHNIIHVNVFETWMSLLIYIAMTINNALFLLTKHPFLCYFLELVPN